jgi:hypothetical protein
MSKLPVVVVPHPIGGIKPGEVIKKADSIIEKVIKALTVE